MSDKRPAKTGLEVSSQELKEELVAIKERLDAIETIESVSNAPVVKKYVEDHLTTNLAKDILRECKVPRTKSYLVSKLQLKNSQALDYHLTPLRVAVLLRESIQADRTIVFEWSNLLRGLPNSTIKAILG